MSIYVKVVYTGTDITTEFSNELSSMPVDEKAAILQEIVDHLKIDLLLVEESL
jgi:hypothetical protein